MTSALDQSKMMVERGDLPMRDPRDLLELVATGRVWWIASGPLSFSYHMTNDDGHWCISLDGLNPALYRHDGWLDAPYGAVLLTEQGAAALNVSHRVRQ